MYKNLFSKAGLSLDRLRVLLEVGAANGIAPAVGGDPVRQSQYSRQLKELEGFFGVQLTHRVGKYLHLTEEGKELARLARESFGALESFAAKADDGTVQLKIGAGDSIIQWLLLPQAGALQLALPSTRLSFRNMQSADIVQAADELELDLGIVGKDRVRAPLSDRPFATLDYALFVPNGLAGPNDKRSCAQLMAELPLVMLEGKGALVNHIAGAMEKSGLQPNTVLEVDSLPQASAAVATGNYASVLPTIASAQLPPDRFREVKSPMFKALRRGLHFIWNPRIEELRPQAVGVQALLAVDGRNP